MRGKLKARSFRQLIAAGAVVGAVVTLLGLPGAAFSSGGYRDAVLADNPVGYWRLSESSGTTITDEFGAGHSGSYSGTVSLGQTSPITTDGSDSAAYFNGGWGSIPYYSDLNPTGDKLSIEFWWKGTAPSAARFMVLKGYTSHSDPYYQYGVGDDTTGKVRVVVDTSGTFSPWDTGVAWPTDGAWHQIVVTYDGSLASNNLKLYIDAVQQAQTNKTGNVRSYSSALGLMDILNLGSGFNTTGRLDDVSIYNGTLSATRISAHYNAATVAPPAAPTNSTLPALSGTAIEGETVTTGNGSWTGSPTSYAYQWRRCNFAGASCSDISGATNASYALASADVGSSIRVAVTATNAGGSTTAVSGVTAVVLSSSATASYEQAAIADNPVGYWRLSESSGTTITDELGAGHSGSYTGAVTLGQTSPITTDASDTAAHFDGGWGSIPYYSDLNPTADKLSIEFWWKGTAPSAARFMVLKGYTSHSDPYYQYGVGDDTTGKVRVVVDTSGTFSPWDTGIAWPSDGAWHQIVATYDGSLGSNNLKLYIDTSLRAQTNRTGNVRSYSSALGLMDILNLGSGFSTTGRLDDVAIYSSALSPSRISAHYDAATVAAPGNTVPPSISGTAIVGQTLTTDNGSWTGSPTSYSYQWRRCDSAGVNCSAISGSTSSSYPVTLADVGSTVRAEVTATNATGSGSASSAASGVVPPTAAPSNVDLPVISGTARQTWILTASTGSWTQAPTTYERQWLRCDEDGEGCGEIDGATAATYTVTAEDMDTTIRVRIVATNALGSTAAVSQATDAVVSLTEVAPPDPGFATQPSLSYNGAHIIGTRWTPVGGGSYKLEFERGNGSWDSSIYECVTFSGWPWNTCGNDLQSYDGLGGAYSYHKEIWDDFGPEAGAEGSTTQTGTYCGDTGLGAPPENPCYVRTWTPEVSVVASGGFLDQDGGVVGGTGTYPLTIEGYDPRVDFGISQTGIARLYWTDEGDNVMGSADADCESGCPASYTASLTIDVSSLAEGSHTFVAKASDPNSSIATGTEWSVTVDRTAPTVPTGLTLDSVDGDRAVITWDESDDPDLGDGAAGAGLDHYEVRSRTNSEDWLPWSSSSDSEVRVQSVEVGDVVTVEVQSADNVGNVSDIATKSFNIVSVTDAPVPQTGPTIDTSSPGESRVLDDSGLTVTDSSAGNTISTQLDATDPNSFTSHVALAPDQHLEKLPNGTVAIVMPVDLGDAAASEDPNQQPGPDFASLPDDVAIPPAWQDQVWQPESDDPTIDQASLTPPHDPGEPPADGVDEFAATDSATLLDKAQQYIPDGLVVGVVGIPRAVGADGEILPARLTATTDSVTATVADPPGTTYPVAASVAVAFDPDIGSALATEQFGNSASHPVVRDGSQCTHGTRLVTYGSSGFQVLLRELAGSTSGPLPPAVNRGPIPCARIYLTVLGSPDDPNGSWRRTQLEQVHLLDCPRCAERNTRFLAAADLGLEGIVAQFPQTPGPSLAYKIGTEERRAMERTGQFHVGAGDSWFVNDIPGPHQGARSFLQDTPKGRRTRTFVKNFVRGLYNGLPSAPRAVPGIVTMGYALHEDSPSRGRPSYVNSWKRMLRQNSLWRGLRPSSKRPYVNFWGQETYVRCAFVCGYSDFDTQQRRTNRYLEHPARLAFAADRGVAVSAKRFFDVTYAPEILGYWASAPANDSRTKTRLLTRKQMLRLVSLQIYATRRWSLRPGSPYPDNRVWLNWYDGTGGNVTPGDRKKLAIRIALALKGAYGAGTYSVKWICDPRQGTEKERCIAARTKYGRNPHVPDWSLFGSAWR